MARRLLLSSVLAIVILGGWTKPSYAQVGAAVAQLNGTVRDASGGSVAKASLSLRNTETNRKYTTVSNENGLYVLANVPPGSYELTTDATGFAKSTQTGIVLTVGQTATIDVTLKVASGVEKVVVTTETPVIEPTKTEISRSEEHTSELQSQFHIVCRLLLE